MDYLQKLQDLQVTKFEPDDDRANLETYGLQPPAWELAFFNGTNQLFALQFGKSPTNDDTQVFARYGGSKTIVRLNRALVDPWRAEHNQFRDPRLAGWIIKPLDAITASGPGENFTLQRQANDKWLVNSPSGTNWPADAVLTFEFIKDLALLEVTNFNGLFSNDTATDKDLSDAGLKEPARKYVLSRSATGIAGAPADQVVAELDFRRPDERRHPCAAAATWRPIIFTPSRPRTSTSCPPPPWPCAITASGTSTSRRSLKLILAAMARPPNLSGSMKTNGTRNLAFGTGT